MADPRHALGLAAEAAAAAWLRRCDWTVVAHRARRPGRGEIDIVARDPGGALVAIEVRARRSRRAGAPEASLDSRRGRRLRQALAAYAAEQQVIHTGLRVDLISAEPDPTQHGSWRLRRLPSIA